MSVTFGATFKKVLYVAISVVIVLSLFGAIWYFLLGQPLSIVFPTETQIEQAVYPKTAPVDIKIKDGISGAAITGATVYIYEIGQYASPVETLSDDNNDGIVSTGDQYTSGDSYMLYISKASAHIFYWTTWKVPNAVSMTSEKLYSVVKAFTLGTFALTIMDGEGNTYGNGANFNKTAGSGSTPGVPSTTITVTIRNTADNTGFYESYDPIYDVYYKAVLVIDVSGTGYEQVSITPPSGAAYQWAGTVRYWFVELPASALVRTKVGNTVQGGVTDVSFAIDLSGYSGDNADLHFDLILYSSVAYRLAKGSFGSFSYDPAIDKTLNLVD